MEQLSEPSESFSLHDGGVTYVFEGINNIVINGNMSRKGEYYTQSREEKRKSQYQSRYSDEQVAQALLNVTGKNKAIDSKQKWAGAYWLLRWECNFPVKLSEFCQRIENLPFPEEPPIKCDYNNIRAFTSLPFMAQDARFPDAVQCAKSEQSIFVQLRHVAIELAKELRKTQS